MATFVTAPAWHDKLLSAGGSWYSSSAGATWSGANGLTGTITTNDSPSTGWPDSNSAGGVITSGKAQYDFDIYICAITLDAPGLYFARGSARWSLLASLGGGVEIGPPVGGPVLTGSVIAPTPAVFTRINTSTQPTPITGMLANDGLNAPNRKFTP